MSAQSDSNAETTPSEDEVLRRIEQAVLDHRLAPGTKLKEVQLANLFGVKRGLIRKVLTRLAHSSLVQQTPNRGATVASPSVKEGQDLFATRRVIESAVLETLIARVEEKDLEHLADMLKREQQAYLGDEPAQALALSVDFHRELARMAGNSVLETYLNDIIRRTPLVILAHLGDDADNRCRNHEHEVIVDAISRRDVKTAVEVMNQHLLQIESKIRHKPEKQNQGLAALLRPEANPDLT
ncbi:MAG: GntR family transcriptional regulator [Gammaproteobacteria bacterium]|jgi:DNA-binding GntR family transcriptional regulator|nr:GntR family transcriptional regulator [Gammaproteobacteria bacterium]